MVPLGDAYGAANVAIQVDCPIEQLINLLTAIAAQPELIYTNELRLTSQKLGTELVITTDAHGEVNGLVAGQPLSRSHQQLHGQRFHEVPDSF